MPIAGARDGGHGSALIRTPAFEPNLVTMSVASFRAILSLFCFKGIFEL
jgi:hypothetical protein